MTNILTTNEICLPENNTVSKYIQNYRLNLIRLAKLSERQAEQFQSDFSFIAKFLSKSYNKEKQLEELKNDNKLLISFRHIFYACFNAALFSNFNAALFRFKIGRAHV